jgi:hypothetical protein
MMYLMNSCGNFADARVKCMTNESVTLVSSYNGYSEVISRAKFEAWLKSEGYTLIE